MRIKQKIKAKIMGGVSIALAFMIGIAPIGVSAKTSEDELIDIPKEVLEQLGITPIVSDTSEGETVIDTGDTEVEATEDIPTDETAGDCEDIIEDLQDISLEDILAGISDYIPEDGSTAEIGDFSEILSDPMRKNTSSS